MRKLGILIALVLAISLANATTALLGGTGSGLIGAVNSLCWSLKQLLPIAAMLMIILAGVIYAAGQMMGAETRARANVWATAALTGALIAILIAVVAPPVLNTIYGGTTIAC
ncbi:Uncharacterised protein [uncultured archaeon]|nr:Uncharacterised protein [uncultured archaeon]